MVTEESVSVWAVPQPDLVILFPENMARLPVPGAYVPWNGPEGTYWKRRLNEGSITVFEEPPTTVEVTAKDAASVDASGPNKSAGGKK